MEILNEIELKGIDGGFDEEAFEAGQAAGRYVRRIISGVLTLSFFL